MDEIDFRPHDHVLYRPVPGAGGVLLDLDRREYFALDSVAARMWEALSESGTVREAVDCLVLEFDVDRRTLNEDLVHFVRELAERTLVQATNV